MIKVVRALSLEKQDFDHSKFDAVFPFRVLDFLELKKHGRTHYNVKKELAFTLLGALA
jgi:hypothetical protein